MTNPRPIDFYNAYMNGEASSYPWGSWITHEDMQISALRAVITSCAYTDDHGTHLINVDDLQELIDGLTEQSNKLKNRLKNNDQA